MFARDPRLQRWITRFKAQPRWAQVAIASGFLVFVLLGIVLVLPGGGTAEAERSASPLALSLEVFFKLIVVVALIYGCALLLRRWNASPARTRVRQMSVLETVHLSPRRALHLVRVGDQVLVIGATDQSVNLISEMDSLVADGTLTTDGESPLPFAAIFQQHQPAGTAGEQQGKHAAQ
jgi:flagellar biosynthetic protein FliO